MHTLRFIRWSVTPSVDSPRLPMRNPGSSLRSGPAGRAYTGYLYTWPILCDQGSEPVSDLREAYAEVERYVRARSSTFRRATELLPADQRQALRAAYAFFRRTDDLADTAGCTPEQLQRWCDLALLPPETQGDPILAAWADVRRRYVVDDNHVAELISGISQDVTRTRYESLPELLDYCYRVASCAGLLTLPIIGLARGATLEQATPYAVRLGQALQMTDILVDVGEDRLLGRVYLPADALAREEVTADDILAGRFDPAVRAVIRDLVAFTRNLYRQAWPGLALLSPTGRAAVGAGTLVFRSDLDEIECRGFDSVTGAAKPSDARRLLAFLLGWPALIGIPRPAT